MCWEERNMEEKRQERAKGRGVKGYGEEMCRGMKEMRKKGKNMLKVSERLWKGKKNV